MRMFILVAFATMVAPCTAGAAQLRYSWAGRLVLASEGATDDPWSIGPNGADFSLEATVSRAGPPDWSPEIPYAIFSPSDVRLWIEGVELEPVEHGVLEFWDDETIELIIVNARFLRLGIAHAFGSAVGLPPSTFSFTRSSELPPVFAPAPTAGPATYGHGPYVSSVEGGVPVTVVPEPLPVVLVRICAASLLIMMRRPRQ